LAAWVQTNTTLPPEQVAQQRAIGDAILRRLGPAGAMTATYQRYDPDPVRQA
jgi:hypothetical protein